VPNGSRIENVATTILALCAVAITLMVGRRELFPPPSQSPLADPTEVGEWKSYATGAKRLGSSPAPVTIVEWADFQCPYCAKMAASLGRLVASYPGQVHVVYRSYPITTLHPHAHAAALAAECAANQERFAQFHDFLYAHQDSIGLRPWAQVAARSGIPDTASFNRCLTAEETLTKVVDDSTAAVALKISGTPTLMVNNQLLAGGMPEDKVLEDLITNELKRARRD
jgi:protein-disulfide isomerase